MVQKAPYVAPEVLTRSEYKAQPTDVWSCGIVLVAMLAGELPWDKPSLECDDFVAWIKNNYHRSPWCKIENSALSLIKNVLNYEPAQRFTIRQVKSSNWYVSSGKPAVPERSEQNNFSRNYVFSSQPAYICLNENNTSTDSSNMSDKSLFSSTMAEFEVNDSQIDCDCESHMHPPPPDALDVNSTRSMATTTTGGGNNHLVSFSQPVTSGDMPFNSQFATQTQNFNSQYGSQFQSQSPLLKLVKRMTRMFVHSNADVCTEELKKLFHKFAYDFKVANANQRQRQITVITSDKRQSLLTFKVNIIEMNSQNEVLVDFRLSKGDGLEFKKIFMKVKEAMAPVVCKKYVFFNTKSCCDRRN